MIKVEADHFDTTSYFPSLDKYPSRITIKTLQNILHISLLPRWLFHFSFCLKVMEFPFCTPLTHFLFSVGYGLYVQERLAQLGSLLTLHFAL